MARQMKDSGVEWIGQIPEEWHVSKIKNVYIVILGKMLSPSQTQKDQTLENYLCAANIKWSGVDTSIQKQMWFSESDKAEYKLHEGDILIMEGGLAGTSCKYRGEMDPCFIQNSVHCCRAKSNYSNQFLYYWMNVVYNSKYIENICNKATIQHYTKEKVMNTPFLICSSLEQEKIVSYLDRKCAQIDAIISKQQQIIEKLKEYKLSVITEAVTKGLDPNVPMKDSGVEWIGKVPKKWKIVPLKVCIDILPGYAFSSNDFDSENGIPLLRGINVTPNGIRWEDVVYWSQPVTKLLENFELSAGDIVVGLDRPWVSEGTRICWVTEKDLPALLLQRVCRIRAKDNIDSRWVYHWIASKSFQEALSIETTGVSVPHISTKQIGQFRAPNKT